MKCPRCGITTLLYLGYVRMELLIYKVTKLKFAHKYICRNMLCQAEYVKAFGRLIPIGRVKA